MKKKPDLMLVLVVLFTFGMLVSGVAQSALL